MHLVVVDIQHLVVVGKHRIDLVVGGVVVVRHNGLVVVVVVGKHHIDLVVVVDRHHIDLVVVGIYLKKKKKIKNMRLINY